MLTFGEEKTQEKQLQSALFSALSDISQKQNDNQNNKTHLPNLNIPLVVDKEVENMKNEKVETYQKTIAKKNKQVNRTIFWKYCMQLSVFFFFIENVCALGNSYKNYHIIFVMVAEQRSCDHILTDISNTQTV